MAKMGITQRIDVEAKSARAVELAAGRTLRIVDVAGGQPGDLVAFNRHDLTEQFSQSRTRVENRNCRPGVGHGLWSNLQPPRVMLTITRDSTNAGHDLLYAPCCRYALAKRFGVQRDGCLENLAAALAPWGLSWRQVPDPLNLFFSVSVAPDGSLAIAEPRSRPGDCVELRAEMDCLVAVSTCAVPNTGRENSGYQLEIFE